MKDSLSEQRLGLLHPKARPIFRKFIEACENALGVTIRITQGLRTFEQQQAIYDQGRTKPGKIVSDAKPGSSFHQYGLAIDTGIIEGGKIKWDYNYQLLQPFAMACGLTWGADWDGDGKTKAQGDKDEHFVDLPHFEIKFGFTWRQLLEMYNQKKFIPGTKYLIL